MLLEKLKNVKALVFDVDGVLTNGDVIADVSGELLRTFNIKDGYALQLAVKKGLKVAIISGGRGEAMERRFLNLGIADVCLGVADKVPVLQILLHKYNLGLEDVLYMGDDMPDLGVMKIVGIATCPADACNDVKQVSAYISPFAGGRMAVRDVIEKVLKLQDKWFDAEPFAVDSGK